MNLKAHIRTCHKELAKQLDEDGWPARLEAGSISTETVSHEEGEEILMEAQAVEHSETGEMTWVTTGEHGEVVQLSHGEHAFSAGTQTSLYIYHFLYSACFFLTL